MSSFGKDVGASRLGYTVRAVPNLFAVCSGFESRGRKWFSPLVRFSASQSTTVLFTLYLTVSFFLLLVPSERRHEPSIFFLRYSMVKRKHKYLKS